MKKSKKQKLYRFVCVLIVSSHIMAVSAPLYAQQPSVPGLPTGASVTPTSITTAVNSALTSLQTGGNITSAAALLNSNSPTPSAQNLQNIQQTLTQLQSAGNLLSGSGAGVLSGLMTGTFNPATALGLAGVPGLGTLTMASQLSAVLGQLQGPISQIAGQLQQAQALAASVATLLSPQGIQNLATAAFQTALTNTIQTNFPQLTAAFGGAAGLISGISNFSNLLQTLGPNQVLSQIFGGALSGALGGALGNALGLGGGSGSSPVQNTLTTATTSLPCCAQVAIQIPKHYFNLRTHIDQEFIQHRNWFLTVFWTQNVLPALMMMANQLTTTGILQIEMIGTLLDAKHQLETQRLFQELTARAHKDYQPSEGMCTIETAVTSLAASERLTNIAQSTFAHRMMQRQTLSGDSLSTESVSSDKRSRLAKFKTTYCSPTDNTNGLSVLCPSVTAGPRQNIDVDYTRNIESKLTLDVDFTNPSATPTTPTSDEEDVFALSANLFSNDVMARITPDLLGDGQGKIRQSAVERLMDMRAVFAKRSVAQNSFAAITSLRASGDDTSAPYTKALIKELGITNPTEIDQILGVKPSYFAQMEVLTKKIYQNPTFYTELYDKPTNVDRKGAALQAIGLMQDRDLFNSLIRSEAVLSVLLETMLEKEQDKIENAQKGMNPAGG